MKQLETAFKERRQFAAIMLLCFLYGGFAILLFFFQAYSTVWRSDVAPIGFDTNASFRDANFLRDSNFLRPARRNELDPFDVITSPISLTFLISGIVAILAGLAIWQLIREKEIKSVKQEMANNLLLPEEKKIIEALKQNNLEATQAKLAKVTGLSKVQVHRTIKKLEAKGILEKHPYGMTNKILLNKKLLE